MSFYEYVFSQKTKMTVTFLLWFVIFFFVNKISKNGEITWKDIFKRKNKPAAPKAVPLLQQPNPEQPLTPTDTTPENDDNK